MPALQLASGRALPATRARISRKARQQTKLRVTTEVTSIDPVVYGGLGLAATSFLGTFLVAPRFKEAFKEDVDWKDMYAELVRAGVKSVAPTEAYAKQKKGVTVPLYLPIQEWDLPSIIRRVGFAFFGIYGTELNTSFADEVKEQIPKGREVIVLCEMGGSLENKSGTQYGFQSRSLKAVYFLRQAGFTKVSVLKGGLGEWVRQGLPVVEGAEDVEEEAVQNSGGQQPTVILSVLERFLNK